MNTQNNHQGQAAKFSGTLEVSEHTRIQLIRKYQRFEGNFECCASAYTRVCDQFECLWRDECQSLVEDKAP